MTPNLHDKMLAAIDAYFSASDAVEEEAAENLLLDVRDEINKHKLAEQPVQQEPMAWIERDMNCDDFDPDSVTCQKPDISSAGWEWVPLYTAPQAQPAREWVGLTEEEKTELRREHYPLPLLLMEATEAKLKEKNT